MVHKQSTRGNINIGRINITMNHERKYKDTIGSKTLNHEKHREDTDRHGT